MRAKQQTQSSDLLISYVDPQADRIEVNLITIEYGDAKAIEELIEDSSKKSVTFDLIHNRVHGEGVPFNVDDLKNAWYNHKEMRTFRDCSFAQARQFARADNLNTAPSSYRIVIENTYDACCQQASSSLGTSSSLSSRNLGDVQSSMSFDSLGSDDICMTDYSLLSIDQQQMLAGWAAVSTGRLGLERWSISKLLSDAIHRRKEIVRVVMEAQDDDGLADSPDSRGANEDTIRRKCEEISRPCQLFAHCLACAQQEADALLE